MRCVSNDAPGVSTRAECTFSRVKGLFRSLLRNNVECVAAFVCSYSVWTVAGDRDPSVFICVSGLPTGFKHKGVIVL